VWQLRSAGNVPGLCQESNCAKPGINQLHRDPVREFPEFEALPVAAAAIRDNLFHVVRGDVAAADITIVVIFTIKWADRIFKHKTSNLPVKNPLRSVQQERVTCHVNATAVPICLEGLSSSEISVVSPAWLV